MQVDTNVSEADIGRITVGQAVTFTVDAFPNTPFSGEVVQVRNAPITVQNVVTYNAVVLVANREMKLKPGMTANVSFLIAERSRALKVPNAALRFQPDSAGQEPGTQDGRGPGSGDRTQALQQRLTQALSLSSEQQARLAGILQNTRQQMMQLLGSKKPRRRTDGGEPAKCRPRHEGRFVTCSLMHNGNSTRRC